MATLPITASPILSAYYNPHEAENGKFLVLDSNTLTGYAGLSGAGKYAILTYDLNAGSEVTTISGNVTISPLVSANGYTGMTPLSVAPIASSLVIGKVGIDQTTPGTTNRVTIADQFNSIVSVSTATTDNFTLTSNRLRTVAVLKAVNYTGTGIDLVRSGIQSDTSLSATGYLNILAATGTTAGAILASSTAFENARIIKQSAGTLISLIGYNSKSTVQFIQLHNTATIPADSAAPMLTIIVAPSSNFSVDVPILGIPFTTGITVCNSLGAPVKTIGSADCFFTATFK